MIRVLLACMILTAASLASASDAQPAFDSDTLARAAELRDALKQGSGAYALVQSLTTEVGPRMAGTDADARGVAWAEATFRSLGFDRVILQPVTFPVWQRRHEQASVLAPYEQPLHITALGGSVSSEGEIQAEIIEFATYADLSKAPDDSLDGKIAFISNRMERFRDGRGYGPAVAARSSGANEAARAGASALLIRSIGTDVHRFPHTGNMRYADGVRKIPAAALSNPDADQLSRLIALGKPVRASIDIDAGMSGSYTSHNVIGEITGRELPEQIVVIGGHLDSWDLGTGAVDDGAGIGITMAAGARIAALPTRPRRTIRVIAFANEEQGLFGAKQYAQHNDMAQHVIGAESDFGAGRIYALRAGVAADRWSTIAAIAEVLAPLDITLEPGAGGPGPDISPMVPLGVPWAQLAQDGTDYFDYHHTADDTLDKIDPKALDQQAAAYAVFAYLSAEMEQTFGRLAPPVTP